VNGRRSRATTRPLRPAAIAAILVLGFFATALGVRATHADRVLPGVHVADVSLGGASKGEVRRRLAAVAEEAAGEPVTLRSEGRRLTVAPAQAGYFADVEETASRALRSGREGPLRGLWSTVAGLFGARREVALAQTVDRRQLGRFVASLADRLGRPAFAGELVIAPQDLAITTKPPRSGREVDRRALAARLAEALQRRPRGTVQAPLRTTRVASRSAVEAVGRAARSYLGAPLRLTGAGEPLDVSPEQLARVLALEARDGGRSVRLGAGDRRLAALVARLAARRDRPARNARIRAPARPVTLDAKGDVSFRPRSADVEVVSEARTGRMVRQAALASAIESAIRADRHAIELPLQRSEPAVSAQDARSVRSLIGTFTTYYVPGQPRVTNIRLIARKVDATIVAPGTRFSLNAAAGERTTAGGYVKAPFIADGKLEESIGGGVSQFSTTLYNAAYFAGLQIDGHRPHSFFIDRYPAGRESTLNFPDIDLTWTNDTRAPVLIRATTGDGSVTVSLYGDNSGRRVSAQNGEREPLSAGDFAITVTRVVRHRDGRVVRQPFTTRYDKPPPPE
jgi:vancomycin resistance protein YoaR